MILDLRLKTQMLRVVVVVEHLLNLVEPVVSNDGYEFSPINKFAFQNYRNVL